MRCKLCPKVYKTPKGRTWRDFNICLNCYIDIKNSNIPIFNRDRIISDNCKYCLKSIPKNPNGGRAYCNESHRQMYYKRQSQKRKNTHEWLSLMEIGNELDG